MVDSHCIDFSLIKVRLIYIKTSMHIQWDLCRSLAARCFGDESVRAMGCIEKYCCESRNPLVQALYLLLVALGYYVYCREFFGFLPQPYAPQWHE